ncbi:MAG: enoyl-CoA hydratase/isomerase family protein, partial [Lautropia sp.]
MSEASTPMAEPTALPTPLGHGVQRADGFWIIELQRAERRNALDETFADALASSFESLARQAPGEPALLCAQGSTFCAGADISFLKGIAPAERERAFAERARTLTPALVRLMTAVQNSDMVTVAAIQGAASGGGWGLALACDFRIAAADASFWFPEVEYGRPLSERTLSMLLAHVGRARATEIAVSARRFSAAELLARGGVYVGVRRVGL